MGHRETVENIISDNTEVVELSNGAAAIEVDGKTTEVLTFGQRAVNYKFNPSGLTEVDETKLKIAAIIDQVNVEKSSYLGNTFKGMAIRSLIQACSDAVRCLTTSEK